MEEATSAKYRLIRRLKRLLFPYTGFFDKHALRMKQWHRGWILGYVVLMFFAALFSLVIGASAEWNMSGQRELYFAPWGKLLSADSAKEREVIAEGGRRAVAMNFPLPKGGETTVFEVRDLQHAYYSAFQDEGDAYSDLPPNGSLQQGTGSTPNPQNRLIAKIGRQFYSVGSKFYVAGYVPDDQVDMMEKVAGATRTPAPYYGLPNADGSWFRTPIPSAIEMWSTTVLFILLFSYGFQILYRMALYFFCGI